MTERERELPSMHKSLIVFDASLITRISRTETERTYSLAKYLYYLRVRPD